MIFVFLMSDQPVVIDLGTGFLKVGLSNSTTPDFLLPNTVGRPILRSDESFSKQKIKDIMICDETTPVRQYLDLTLPVEHGVVTNWDDETLVLDYIFKNKLQIENKDHPILITEAPMNPIDNRKKMCEVFFETLGFPALQVSPQALLVLYAQGLVTGVVVDSGDGVTHIMPIAETCLLPHCVGRMNIAGRDITEHMVKLLTLRGYPFHKTSDFDVVREIKEKLCFISADIKADRKLANETTAYVVPYSLPDSRLIKVSGERFEAPEVLFNPSALGYEGEGLSEMVFQTIMKTDIDLRKKFFESIVISGGTTMFPGMSTRLTNDIRKLVKDRILGGDEKKLGSYKIHVEDPPNRRFLVYLGATVLANLSQGKSNMWATSQDWKEDPNTVIKRWQSLA